MIPTVKQKKDLKVSVWSGGKTTELFVFPENSSYLERNFEIRISSATVDETPSQFTALPGYHRVLMPLSAPLRLVFDGQKEAVAAPFEVVEFDGGWKTVSHGICTDIGIMLSKDWDGRLFAAQNGVFDCPDGFAGVYAISDQVDIFIDKTKYILMQGDFLIFKTGAGDKITFVIPHEKAAVMAVVSRKNRK